MTYYAMKEDGSLIGPFPKKSELKKAISEMPDGMYPVLKQVGAYHVGEEIVHKVSLIV